MTTFDGTTDYEPPSGPMLGSRPVDEPDESKPYDAFEALREQLDERDEEDPDVTPVEIPGIGWRLLCRTDFDYGAYKNWQKAALPRNQRNGRKTNPLDMDQALLSHLVLVNTCESVEYRRGDGDWEQLCEPDGSPATLQSGALLNHMKVVDPRVLVKKLFGRDGRLIAAGQKVISDAGYGDDGDDAEDPTG